MADNPLAAKSGLELRVHQSNQEDLRQRGSLSGAYLTVVCVLALCGFTLFVEWKNISLALLELFPSLSNGQGFGQVTDTLAFASVAAILLAEVLMDKASANWSPRTRRLVDLIGIVALALFVVSAMVLLPTSVAQANDTGDAATATTLQGANLAFALMLAALFPVSLLANFALFERLKPALAKIQRSKEIDHRVGTKRTALSRYNAKRAELRAVRAQQASLPDPEQEAAEFAASTEATIGRVRGHIGEVIVARETAALSSADKPFRASDDDLLNSAPIEKLRAHYSYLRTITPASIHRIIARKES